MASSTYFIFTPRQFLVKFGNNIEHYLFFSWLKKTKIVSK